MAITVPGSGSSATTSVTIPAHAVGDMIVIAARGTVAPTAPAAGGTVPTWTTPTNQTGVNNSVGWRLATTIATATNHTSGTWTSAAQMHVLVLRPTSGNTLAVGNDPAQGGANNTQTMIYPAFTLTASKVSNLVIRYGARGTADTEVRTDGAFTASGTWHTEQPATTPTSAVFSKVVTASEGTFTATPAGTNAAYRCGTVEITETAAATNWSQPEDEAIPGTDAQAKSATSPKADAIAGTDATSRLWAALRTQPDTAAGTDNQAKAVGHPLADAATVTDEINAVPGVGGEAYEQPVDDSITATDARTSSVSHALADPAAATDAASRRVGSARADTVAGTDARTSASAKPVADAIAGTDVQARAWAARFTAADNAAWADHVDASTEAGNDFTHEVDDALAIADATSSATARTLGDALTGTDARSSAAGHAVADSASGTDAFARVAAYIRSLSDAGVLADDVAGGTPGERWEPDTDGEWITDAGDPWTPDGDEDWPPDTDADWEPQTDERWPVSAESSW